MPYILNAFYFMISLFLLPVWLFQMVTTGEHREGLWQKFCGAAPKPDGDKPVLWCHAVSIGEVLVLVPLLARLRGERPDLEIVISTFTTGGYAVARDRFEDLKVFYAPLDLTWPVRRAFHTIQPRMLLLSELELWPNLLLEAKRRDVPVVVVNSRINDQDFRFFQRIRLIHRKSLTAIRWWGAQTPHDAQRIEKLLGQAPTRVIVTGSLKYEGAARDRYNPQTQKLRTLLGFKDHETIFVAGSTHPPEEQIAVDTFRKLQHDYPQLRLVLVPRNSVRFGEVAKLLGEGGFSFVQRSGIRDPLLHSAPVTLIDSVGELSSIWGLADFAFVGGSLAEGHGGQSMIEPAGYGAATCFGPNVWNFGETVQQLLLADAAVQIESPQQLLNVLRRWLVAPDHAAELGERAQEFIRSQTGALEKTFCAIQDVLAEVC